MLVNVPEPDELDRAQGWQLAAELGEQVRAAKLGADAAGTAADQAAAEYRVTRSAAESMDATLRALVAALISSGPLGPAIERARQAVGLPPVS